MMRTQDEYNQIIDGLEREIKDLRRWKEFAQAIIVLAVLVALGAIGRYS